MHTKPPLYEGLLNLNKSTKNYDDSDKKIQRSYPRSDVRSAGDVMYHQFDVV